MTFEETKRLRDERLRRGLLTAIYFAAKYAPTGWISGTSAADEADKNRAADQRVEGEDHALHLLRDLVALELVEQKVVGRRRDQLRLRLDQVMYRPTAKGNSLYREEIAPVPGVWDERIVED